MTGSEIDSIYVDLDSLGFDSLAMLELIMTMNRFFGLHRTGIEDYLMVERRLGDWVALLTEHFARAPSDLCLTFLTSGSSGTPREIAHRFDRLSTEVTALQQGPLTMLRPEARILALVPPQHIYGFLFTALLPTLGGHDVIDLYRAGPGAALRLARKGDLIVGTPLNWRHLNQLDTRFASGVHGVVSTGPTDLGTWQVLRKNGLESLTEIYGSTETAGIATRTAYDAPFTLMPHLRRQGEGVAGSAGPLAMQDRLIWMDQQSFLLDGRLDDVVQVGGVNVSLTLLREHILAIDGVEDATIRLGGLRLKAFVQTCVTEDGHPDLDSRIRSALASRLPSVAVPQSIRFGPTLLRNAMGKLCDWPVEDLDTGA